MESKEELLITVENTEYGQYAEISLDPDSTIHDVVEAMKSLLLFLGYSQITIDELMQGNHE